MSDDESDVWGHGDDDNESEGLATAESRALEERFRKIGFHQAYDEAKEELLQEGFETGYKETFAIAKEIGILLGRGVIHSQVEERTRRSSSTSTSPGNGGEQSTSTTSTITNNALDQTMKQLIRERLTCPDLKTSDLQDLKKEIEDMDAESATKTTLRRVAPRTCKGPSSLLPLITLAIISIMTTTATAFLLSPRRSLLHRHGPVVSSSRLLVGAGSPRQGVELPLLDILESEPYLNQYVQPLPSAHLPDEITTLHVYGMQVVVPLHQSVLEYAATANDAERNFGHLAWKPANGSLVGAIGCAAQVLVPPGMLQAEAGMTMESSSSDEAVATAAELFEGGKPQVMLCRGTFRFIVREIKQSVPFPVVVVDEILDNDNEKSKSGTATASEKDELKNKDDDDDDNDDMYADLSESQLIRRTLQATQSFVDQQLEATSQQISPLEQSIIEQSGIPDMAAQRQATEEMAAVWDVFQQYLVDDCPVSERAWSIAFLAAEITNVSNDVRRQVLQLTDRTERLRVVLRTLESTVGMVQARKMAQTISQEVAPGDSDPKELQVGQASLPPWVKNIRKGMMVEYFWNEEWGWSKCTVVEDPVFVVDEYLITVEFEDGEVHKLPFQADEKARWRPARPSTFE